MAQVDYFLKLDGIDGESADKEFAKWIEVLSWSWGETQPGTAGGGGGGGAGKVSMQDFHFTAQFSKASPKLFLSCATGQHIRDAMLWGRNDRAGVFLKIKLTDLLVSSYQTGASVGIMPSDASSLNFVKIEIQDTAFDQQDNTGG